MSLAHGYFFSNYGAWSFGTLTGATTDETSNVLTFPNGGGFWSSNVFDTALWDIGTWDQWLISITPGTGVTYTVQARALDVANDVVTPFTILTPNSLSIPAKRYVQLAIATNGSAVVNSLSFYWNGGGFSQTFGLPGSYVSVGQDFTFTEPIKRGVINYAGTQFSLSAQYPSPIDNHLKVSVPVDSYFSWISNLAQRASVSDLVPISSGGVLSYPYLTGIQNSGFSNLISTNITNSILSPVSLTQVAQEKFNSNTPYLSDSVYNTYEKDLFISDFLTNTPGYIVLEMGLQVPGKTNNTDNPIVDTSLIGAITLSLNGATPIDIKPYLGNLIYSDISSVYVPISGFTVQENTVVVKLVPIAGEQLIMGIDNANQGLSFGVNNIGRVGLSGELRVWAYAPEKRPILNTFAFANLPATATVQKPYIDLPALATVYRTNSILFPATTIVQRDSQKYFDASALLVRQYRDLPATAHIGGKRDLSSTADVIRPYANLPAQSYVTSPILLPANTVVKWRKDLVANADVVRPYADLISSAHVATFKYLQSSANVTAPILLQAMAQVIKAYSDLVSTAVVENKGTKDIIANTSVIKAYRVFTCIADVESPGTKDFPATAIIKNGGRTLFPSSAVVRKPLGVLPCTAEIYPRNSLQCTAIVERPSTLLPCNTEVLKFRTVLLGATANIEPATSKYFNAVAQVNASRFFPCSAITALPSSAKGLPCRADIILARKNFVIATTFVLYRTDLTATATIQKPFKLFRCTSDIKANRIGSIDIEDVFTSSGNFAVGDFLEITELLTNPTTEDMFFNLSDDDSFIRMDVQIGRTPLEDLYFNIADYMPGIYSGLDENANWTTPIKLTNNILPGENVVNPAIGEIDGYLFVGYEMNEPSGNLVNLHFAKTYDIGSHLSWSPVKRLDGNKPSFSNNRFEYTGKDGIYEWQPPNPGSELYSPDIELIPIKKTDHKDIEKDFQNTIYRQKAAGEIIYPPPEWGYNPLIEDLIFKLDDGSDSTENTSDPRFSPVTNKSFYIQSLTPFNSGIIVFMKTIITGNVGG